MTDAVLGLGGNIGDRRVNLARAVKRLADWPGVTLSAVSALYETPPWGVTEQPAFLNAAVRVETLLPPQGLLSAVLGIERALGRDRRERWGPRNIDIDILVFGDVELDEPGLHLPHPHLHERAFALAPLLDVMPDAEIAGRPAAEWLAACSETGIRRIAGPDWPQPVEAQYGSR